jgi:hypothetical protein
MQPHPEVNEGAQMIGWQPVFASRPSSSPAQNQNLIPLLGLAIAALFVAVAGGALFKQHQDMNGQKTVWQQEAIAHERTRVMECVSGKH